MLRTAVALAALLVFAASSGAGAETGPTLESCRLAGGLEARCGTFVVPENRAQDGGRTISLRVAVLPARDGGTAADPVVYLAGGPGGSAVEDAAGMASIFAALNESRDVVLVDQRGTGGSSRLECPPPATGFRVELARPATVRAYVRSCLSRVDADPRQYTTAPAMDDLAEVLRALGYVQVNVYGVSYGATAAQYFLAQHPALVRTVILDGATLLDVPIFERWGPNGERAVRGILARCAASPRCARAYPRARSELFEAIAVLRRKPVRVDDTVVDAATAAGAIQTLSRTPLGAAQIPWLAHRARAGDWLPLLLEIDRQGGTFAPATRRVMFWSIVCNEPWARWSPARTAAASRGTYLAERTALDARAVATVCAGVPKSPQPDWSSARVHSDRPVLIVVGGADPQDPLANVAGAERELPASRTVIVPAGGHVSLQLGCVRDLATRFVDQGSAVGLDTGCAARYVPPPFVLR